MDLVQKMKPTAVLMNTSRGAIVKEADLIDALEAGYLAGVGLDVFENESGGLDPRFLALPNAVLTPHVAWNTKEATLAIHEEVTGNVLRFLRGERPEGRVHPDRGRSLWLLFLTNYSCFSRSSAHKKCGKSPFLSQISPQHGHYIPY
jgi:phosphoglycerate dehydrogenase-like enzyme